MADNAWDIFFGNPIIESYFEEVDISNEQLQDQNGEQDNGQRKLSDDEAKQLSQDLMQGHIDQDEIVNMFKSGKITREDVKTIIQMTQSNNETPEEGGELPPEEQPQSEEELLAQQIDQTNDLFVKFALYDKILELTDKLDFFKENFNNVDSELYKKVQQLSEFLNILSSLVFNIETAVAYQMYGGILLQLTELFQEYNQNIQPQKIKEDKIKDIKREIIDDKDIPVTDEEKWAQDNKSYLLPDDEQAQYNATNDYT